MGKMVAKYSGRLNIYKILLIGILIVGALLRLWQLGNIPPSPDWDEVSHGYNAYSIMKTGRDEYGAFLPVVLRSFGDYKPALYTYFVMPFISLFGVSVLSVRLPSAIFGILTIFAAYLLVKELFDSREITQNKSPNNAKILALLSAFLLAISPWHIQFSRVGFESNIGLAFNVFMLLFILKSIKKSWMMVLAIICAVCSLYSYQSEKIFTPLIFIFTIVIFRKELVRLPKTIIISSVLVGLLLLLPMAVFTVRNPNTFQRAQMTSITADKSLLNHSSNRLIFDRQNKNYIGLVMNNRRVVYLKEILRGYISHFYLNWLFLNGDNPRHHAPYMGLLYLWELPFVFIGIYALLFHKFDKKIRWLLFSWFLLAPIPAAFTHGVPHAVRTLNFLPTFQLFTALGLLAVWNFGMKYYGLGIKYKIIISTLFAFCFLLFTLNFTYFLNQYFVQLPYYSAVDWQYGYKEVVPFIDNIKYKYSKVVVSNQQPLDQSYIFFLFYSQYSPEKYQREVYNKRTNPDVSHAFDIYEFRLINLKEISPDTLYIGIPSDFPDKIMPIKVINYPDGSPGILVVDGKVILKLQQDLKRKATGFYP